MKSSLTKKGHINSGDIILTHGKNILTYEGQLAKVFNNHYINIVSHDINNRILKGVFASQAKIAVV